MPMIGLGMCVGVISSSWVAAGNCWLCNKLWQIELEQKNIICSYALSCFYPIYLLDRPSIPVLSPLNWKLSIVASSHCKFWFYIPENRKVHIIMILWGQYHLCCACSCAVLCQEKSQVGITITTMSQQPFSLSSSPPPTQTWVVANSNDHWRWVAKGAVTASSPSAGTLNSSRHDFQSLLSIVHVPISAGVTMNTASTGYNTPYTLSSNEMSRRLNGISEEDLEGTTNVGGISSI